MSATPGQTGDPRTGLPGGVRGVLLVILAALPGLLLAAAALLGRSPSLRDLPDYFVPLRQHTTEVLTGHASPFWTTAVGCGEPFFANPQSGILYPPTWLATVMPAPRAVGVEAGLHLALLSVGCLLLAWRLGARPWLALAAAWGACLAGPTSDAVGVLNNLETLAWIPWVWWAALGGLVPVTAGFLALAYLGAEPQLAAIAGVVALVLAPSRRTVAAVALAVGLVAVQALPFLAWVHEGNRGPSRDLDAICAGALGVDDLAGVVAPGALLPDRSDRFVANPAVPLWLLVLGATALLADDRRTRKLAASGWVLIVLAILPDFAWGGRLWAAASLGLVRYPSRLVFPAVLALAPAGVAAFRPGRRLAAAGSTAGALALVLALGSGAPPAGTVVQAVAAISCSVEPLAPWAALAGAAALGGRDVNHLRLEPLAPPPLTPCLAPQQGARIYTVQPSREQAAWVHQDPEVRRQALGWGYQALVDGRRLARTFAPLQSRRLARHLAEADRGPAGRWWLDALAAPVLVAHHELPGFPVLCRDSGIVTCRNPQAWPEAALVSRVPAPGQEPEPTGRILEVTASEASWSRRVRLDAGGGVLLWSSTPDLGWHFEVDGKPVAVEPGPGILQGIPVPAGEHLVTAAYRPRGLLVGGAISLGSLGVLLFAARRRGEGQLSPPAVPRAPTS
jgi:hypothetical protein